VRIVSLLPSATEIVCAVGAEAELVGVSHECDFPEGVRRLPVLTSARIDARGSSQAIDAAVRGVIRDALSIYAVDERALGDLAPDVVVTQDLCEVCAVSLDDVRAAVARLAHRDSIAVVSLRPTRLADVWADIETVATALDRGPRGADVRATIESRVRAIEQRARRAPARPRVVTVEWLEPIMLGGTWMPELIELAGGTAVGASAGAPAPTVTPSELAALAPDVVLVKPCGFSIERTLAERPLVDAIARAVPRARVLVSDGNAFFNRPGPRLLESLEILAAGVHPELFPDFAGKHAAVIVASPMHP
jgi:iron complex transport system substrate-binding protein